MTRRSIRLRRALGLGGILVLALVGPMVGAALAAPQAVVVAEEDAGGGEAPAEPEPAAPVDSAPASEDAPAEPAPAEPEPSEDAPAEPAPASEDAPADPDAPADEEALDEEALDEEALDEEALDEEALDEEVVEEEALDEEIVEEEVVEEEIVEEIVEEEIVEEVVEEEVVEETFSDVSLELVIDDSDGLRVSVIGAGLLPESRVELWVFSTPRLIATSTVDAAGALTLSASLPDDLPEGTHTVLIKGTDIDGQPIELGDGIELGPDGELLAVTKGVDVSGLQVPTIPDDPKAPQYPTVAPLDQPDAVVSTTVAALALLSVTGVATAMSGGVPRVGRVEAGGLAGEGINEGLGSGSVLLTLDDIDVQHNRGWRTRFTARRTAWGDTSWLHRAPLTSIVDEASFVWMSAVGSKSPLLARMIGDGAPLRAMVGSLSLLLPIAAIVLGIWSAIGGDGIAEPPVLGILIAMMVIGVVDGLAGGLGAVAFGVTVIAMGGILDWSSVRTLLGVGLLIAGPGLIASSFRDIRRVAPRSWSGWWERGTDIVIVPLLGAFTTYNVANAMPPLGGSLFPVADASAQLAWIVAAMLVVKVLLEELAARWFPERMATILAEPTWPGSLQQVLSSLIRLGLFIFISAAFIGSPWQLWVGAIIWIVPSLLALACARWPNLPRLWQVLPGDLPALGFGLLVYLILVLVLTSIFGDTDEFAVMSFFILLIPGFILGILGLFGREPQSDDVRWYLRPSMTGLYRVGGVVVLVITSWLAYRSIF